MAVVSGLTYKLATINDAPQIAEAIATCFSPHPNLLADLTYRFSLPFPQHFCLTTTSNNQVIAVLEMVVLDNTAFLMNLCVLPNFRNLGIASNLVATSHLIADQLGVKHIYLTVLPNATVKNLYLKLGYLELNPVLFNGIQALLMGRSLL